MAYRLMTLLVIPVIFLCTKCWAIQCYQCESLRDNNCTDDRLDPRYLRECPETHNYCRKIISAFYFKETDEFLTVRECATQGSDEKRCYRAKYTGDSYQYVCECRNSEGCNLSAALAVKNLTIFVCLFYSIFHPLISD